MLKKIIYFFVRRIKRIYEIERYYSITYKELIKNYNVTNNKNIWFIGAAHYNNIGDLAISEATVKYIEDNYANYNKIEIRLCDYYKYSKSLKKLIKKEDIIILQGGGNMGFSYFDAEYNRRLVLKKFKNVKTIIFPSTIDYGKSKREQFEFEKSKRIYNKHNNLIICAREEKSYKIMKQAYCNASVILVPDIVLYLKHILFDKNSDNIIVCMRNDIEKTNESNKVYEYLKKMNNCIFMDNVTKESNISSSQRKLILSDKLKELSFGKIVITDRLHVMIFCTIIEQYCLFIDNSNKKISGVYDKWIKNNYNYIEKLDVNENLELQIERLMKKQIEFNTEYLNELNQINN